MKRKTVVAALLLAVYCLCLATGVLLLRSLFIAHFRTLLSAGTEAFPEEALRFADVLLTAERTEGDHASALGLTKAYYTLAAAAVFPPPAVLLLSATAILPPAVGVTVFFVRRRRENTAAEALETRVKDARADGWRFVPQNDDERLLSTLFEDCRALTEIKARREEELKIYVENVAHQIKTPLQGLTLQLDLLGEELGENARLALANDEALRIGDYIGRLLTLSRLKSGRVGLQKLEVDMEEIAEELLSLPRFAKVAFQRLGSAPAVVTGDPDWLRQALLNLLQNAVTYGENAVFTLDTTAPEVRIRIENDAPASALPEDPFLRYAVAAEDGASTGVGLSIAREVISALGGRVTLAPTAENKVLAEVFLPVYRFSEKL